MSRARLLAQLWIGFKLGLCAGAGKALYPWLQNSSGVRACTVDHALLANSNARRLRLRFPLPADLRRPLSGSSKFESRYLLTAKAYRTEATDNSSASHGTPC
jgi:hypothetical protein